MKQEDSPKLHDLSLGLSPELLGMMENDAGRGVPELEHCDNADDVDPFSGVAFGMTLLEQLLLAIIAAHPGPAQTDRQRLNGAMKALTGRIASLNPLPSDRDERALLWMKTSELRHRRLGHEISDRALAIEAAYKFFPNFEPEQDMSNANRLREKFGGTYDKKRAKAAIKRGGTPRELPCVPATLAYRVNQHDYVIESLEHKILHRIANELRAAGVAIRLADD